VIFHSQKTLFLYLAQEEIYSQHMFTGGETKHQSDINLAISDWVGEWVICLASALLTYQSLLMMDEIFHKQSFHGNSLPKGCSSSMCCMLELHRVLVLKSCQWSFPISMIASCTVDLVDLLVKCMHMLWYPFELQLLRFLA